MGSCTIQKRVHRKGWFVQWNLNQSNQNDNNTIRQTQLAEQQKSFEVETKTPIEDVSQQEVKLLINSSERHIDQIQKDQHSIGVISILDANYEDALINSSKTSEKQPFASSGIQFSKISASPTRIPTLAWVLLIIGLALLALAIIAGIAFLISTGSLIGTPSYVIVSLLAGVLFLILATQTALAPLQPQRNHPDPRYEKEEPQREKKERQPLEKGDKIFIAVAAGIFAIIGIALLAF